MQQAQDIELAKKTKICIEKIQTLKDHSKMLDLEHSQLKHELSKLEPKMEVQREEAKLASKLEAQKEHQEKLKALELVKNSLKTYG